jgi:hypothetical protein
MMNPKLKLAISSYVRSYFVAVVGMITIGENDYKKIAITALAVGVVGPAIRAVNPKDPAFGLIADKAEVEIKKLVVADKKKATKKKA